MRTLLSISLILLLSSCFKKDDPVTPFDRGDLTLIEIEMGSRYGQQLFFDLNQNKVIKQNPKTAWDFAFSCEAGKTDIKLNSGRFMFAAATGKMNFEEVSDSLGLDFKWDYPNAKTDSFALFGWDQREQVYILDMGFDLDNQNMGLVKIKFKQVDQETISFEYMDLDGTNPGSGTLKKDPDYNYSYHSILDQQNVRIEPPKKDYDLYFGQYIFYFVEEDKAYYVNGVLLNPYKVETATIYGTEYSEIGESSIDEASFVTTPDIIGYDWKFYNFEQSRFEIVPLRNYLIRDVEGFIYKIRFTGFYNKEGEKGYPQLESKKL